MFGCLSKEMSTFCAPFWTEAPNVLWENWSDFFPFTSDARRCTAGALNSLTRFGIYLGVLLAVLYRSYQYLGITVGLAIMAIAAYYGMKYKGTVREGFTDLVAPTMITSPGFQPPTYIGGAAAADKNVADVIGASDRTGPTGANPFMNVLINEIKDNPTRGPALTVSGADGSNDLSDVFQTRMYGDPTDVFQHNQNQRTWVVQPSTSIPNDQASFANWLYRVPGRTCKEGNNSACRTGTEGGVVTWLSSP